MPTVARKALAALGALALALAVAAGASAGHHAPAQRPAVTHTVADDPMYHHT